jgi:hypothetical protein
VDGPIQVAEGPRGRAVLRECGPVSPIGGQETLWSDCEGGIKTGFCCPESASIKWLKQDLAATIDSGRTAE